jgi:hypothetical protein
VCVCVYYASVVDRDKHEALINALESAEGDQKKLAETFQREFDWLKDASDDELVQINEFTLLMLRSEMDERNEVYQVPDGVRAVLAMSALLDAVNERMGTQGKVPTAPELPIRSAARDLGSSVATFWRSLRSQRFGRGDR